MSRGLKIDRADWSTVQHGSGAPTVAIRGNIYIDDLTGTTWTREKDGTWGQMNVGGYWRKDGTILSPVTSTDALSISAAETVDETVNVRVGVMPTAPTKNVFTAASTVEGTSSTKEANVRVAARYDSSASLPGSDFKSTAILIADTGFDAPAGADTKVTIYSNCAQPGEALSHLYLGALNFSNKGPDFSRINLFTDGYIRADAPQDDGWIGLYSGGDIFLDSNKNDVLINADEGQVRLESTTSNYFQVTPGSSRWSVDNGTATIQNTTSAVSAIALSAPIGGINIDAGSPGIDIDSIGNFVLDTSAGAILLTSLGGPVNINGESGVLLQSDLSASNAIRLYASNSIGGVNIDAGSAGVDIESVGGEINLTSTSVGQIKLSVDNDGSYFQINPSGTSWTSDTLMIMESSIASITAIDIFANNGGTVAGIRLRSSNGVRLSHFAGDCDLDSTKAAQTSIGKYARTQWQGELVNSADSLDSSADTFSQTLVNQTLILETTGTGIAEPMYIDSLGTESILLEQGEYGFFKIRVMAVSQEGQIAFRVWDIDCVLYRGSGNIQLSSGTVTQVDTGGSAGILSSLITPFLQVTNPDLFEIWVGNSAGYTIRWVASIDGPMLKGFAGT